MEKKWVQSLGWDVPLERKWQSTPVLLLGKSRGQRSLRGYSPCSHKRVRPNLRIQQEQDTFSSNNLASIFPSGSNTWIYFLELVIG